MYEVKEISQEFPKEKKSYKVLIIVSVVVLTLLLLGVLVFVFWEKLFLKDTAVEKRMPNIAVLDATKDLNAEPFVINHSTNSLGEKRFESSDLAVAKIDSSGLVTIQGLGSATITFSVQEDEKYFASSDTAVLSIKRLGHERIATPELEKVSLGQGVPISWDPLETAINGYDIEIYRDRGAGWELIGPNESKSNNTVIPSSELKVGDKIRFRVRAKETEIHEIGDWSPYSNDQEVQNPALQHQAPGGLHF